MIAVNEASVSIRRKVWMKEKGRSFDRAYPEEKGRSDFVFGFD